MYIYLCIYLYLQILIYIKFKLLVTSLSSTRLASECACWRVVCVFERGRARLMWCTVVCVCVYACMFACVYLFACVFECVRVCIEVRLCVCVHVCGVASTHWVQKSPVSLSKEPKAICKKAYNQLSHHLQMSPLAYPLQITTPRRNNGATYTYFAQKNPIYIFAKNSRYHPQRNSKPSLTLCTR